MLAYRSLKLTLPLLCAAAVACLSSRSEAEESYRNDPFRVRYPAKVHHYDVKEDKFYHFKSVLVPKPSDQPQNSMGRYGNRLTQFRYIGPTKGAGIYGAMDRYKESLNLDAGRYKYRMER